MTGALSEEVRAFLQERRFAVLATINGDGSVQQTVVWYELDGDEVVMNATPYRVKTRNLRRDPRASICVEDGYTWVTIRGSVRFVEDSQIAQDDIRRLAVRYDGAESAERQMREQFSRQERITIRLQPEKVTVYGL
jgi:PPOX class probable F420-dependent enzyme